jgi:hypothetical protein
VTGPDRDRRNARNRADERHGQLLVVDRSGSRHSDQ